MLKSQKLVFLLSLSLFWSVSAFAATRTIQFSGVATSDFANFEFDAQAVVAACVVTVMNTGSTAQRITDMRFLGVDVLTPSVGWAIVPNGSIVDSKFPSGTNCQGANSTLQEAEFCMFRYTLPTNALTGRVANCAGRITVQDVDPALPGSVVASGAINLNQETRALGGVLSGAYYASGSPITVTNVNVYKGGVSSPGLGLTSYNMNMYCARACIADAGVPSPVPWTQQQCEEHCGMRSKDPATGNPVQTAMDQGNTVRNVSSFAEDAESLPGNTYPAPACSYIRTANPRYAGGMVYEMIFGPFMSICSGNTAYAAALGSDFNLADGSGAQNEVVWSGMQTPITDAPPHRLFCAQRHQQTDLFFNTGSSSSFVVNGGMPF